MNIILTCFFAAHWGFWTGRILAKDNIDYTMAWLILGSFLHALMICGIWGLLK